VSFAGEDKNELHESKISEANLDELARRGVCTVIFGIRENSDFSSETINNFLSCLQGTTGMQPFPDCFELPGHRQPIPDGSRSCL